MVLALVLQEPIRRRMGNEGHAASLKVEVVEAEANTTNSFVRIEVQAKVVAATLPAQLDVGVDHFTVITGAGIHIQVHPGAQHQRADDLLGDAEAEGAEINNPVELKGAGTVAKGAPTDQRQLGEVQEGFAQGAQRQGGPATEAEAFLVIARSIDRSPGVDVGVQGQAGDHGNR